jgi:histidinol-phosphatase
MDLADGISLPRFRRPRLEVRYKADGGIVTDVDAAIETALRAVLGAQRPADAILGEEFGGTQDQARVWMIDPIDGTAAFAEGGQDWSTLIALVEDGVPAVGVVSRPASGRRWWAATGCGAFADGRAIGVSGTERLADSTMCEDFRRSIRRGLATNPLAALAQRCSRIAPWIDRSSVMLPIASGDADFLVNWWGGKGSDLASSICVLHEAGGRFSDLRGRLDIDADIQVMSNGHLHSQLLELLNEMIGLGEFDATVAPDEDTGAIREARRRQPRQ